MGLKTSPGRLLATLFLATGALVLPGCDWFVAYNVINLTGGTLTTGWFYDACSPETEARLSRGPLRRLIQPGENVYVSGVVPSEPECVVIKTEDQSVISLQPYSTGAYFEVRDPLGDGHSLEVTLYTGAIDALPPPRDAESYTVGGDVESDPWDYAVVLGALVLVSGGVSLFFYRRMRR